MIAEIGLNHGGDLKIAKELIHKAKDAGCWGVKFQYRDVKSFYKNKDEVSDVIIYDEIKKNYISVNDLICLAKLCKELKINFGISIFRNRDLEKLDQILPFIDFFKIPSPECLNSYLIDEVLNRKKKTFVSTGAHETRKVIEHLKYYQEDIILLHCISNYPSIFGTQDMAVIENFRENGFSSVGYSSHDKEWEVCLVALAQGADWIERHITLSKEGDGLDHSSSSTFEEFVKLTRFATGYKSVIGAKNHVPNQGELINLQNLGTGLYARRDVQSGERALLEDFDIKAPRIGISPADFVKGFYHQELSKGIVKGQALAANNYSVLESNIDRKTKLFAREKNLGLPVRFHDYKFFKTKFDVGTYEFHLSFTEALHGDFDDVVFDIDEKENISIHLPDYLPGNKLIDPIARDSEVKLISRQLIDRVILLANKIEQKISRKVKIVGSFSECHNDVRETNLNEIFSYINNLNGTILPQWLPVYAWYFGGSVRLELFNSLEDINYIISNNLKICLDVSHLVMSASYYDVNWKSWYQKLLPCVEHIHISDASDATSEGLMFGDGIIGDFSGILELKKLKIIECWQGHINEGEGFKKSLDILVAQSGAIK